MIHVHSLADLVTWAGQELGRSDWATVSQEQINAFAAATGDRQWIHCDPQRARLESPYGGAIAHGFLTLSLCPLLIGQIVQFAGAKLVVNYGLNRVRFPQAVPAGSRIRLLLRLDQVKEVESATDLMLQCTVEIDGIAKPACVAELVMRVYF